MARGVGINVPRVSLGVFALGAGAGRAGRGHRRRLPRRVSRAPTSRCCPTPSSSSSWAGMGSLPGAMVGQPARRDCSTTSARPSSPSCRTSRSSRPWPSSSPSGPRGSSAASDRAPRRWSRAGSVRAGPRPRRRAAVLPAVPLTLLTQTLIFAILAMSLDLMLGYTGLSVARPRRLLRRRRLRVAHPGHASIGRASGRLPRRGRRCWPPSTAAVFGLLALRATGVYFLMITLALGMVIWGLAYPLGVAHPGRQRDLGVPRPDLGCPGRFAAPCPSTTSSWSAAALAWAVLRLLVRSPFGLDAASASARASRACARSATTCGCTSTSPSCISGGVGGLRRRALGLLQRLRGAHRRRSS